MLGCCSDDDSLHYWRRGFTISKHCFYCGFYAWYCFLYYFYSIVYWLLSKSLHQRRQYPHDNDEENNLPQVA